MSETRLRAVIRIGEQETGGAKRTPKQVVRPDDDGDNQVGIYDAKESGSFENSCGLVLGVWKTSKTDMVARVLKNTRGYEVAMRLRDNTYIIEPVAT